MVEVTEWFEPSAIPNHGVPVLAEYYPFNTRSNALAQQVVWFWEGEYRLYPQTTGTAYVERWAHLPSYQQARIEALEADNARARAQGQDEGFAAAVQELRDMSARKPLPTLWHAASVLADSLEQSRIPCQALESKP